MVADLGGARLTHVVRELSPPQRCTGTPSCHRPPSDHHHRLLETPFQVFDRATKHPNATVVSWASPRVLLIRDFLAPPEVAHLVALATGGGGSGGEGGGGLQRSEVVSDSASRHAARTSYGTWLNGAKRDNKVRGGGGEACRGAAAVMHAQSNCQRLWHPICSPAPHTAHTPSPLRCCRCARSRAASIP